MSEKRISFSNIVKNQLPEYVKEEFPLVVEFLSQYYLSQEFQGAPTDLIQNIDKYVKVDNFSNQTDSVVLLDNITEIDSTILVDVIQTKTGTNGFPEKYGILQIDDEIITYTGKTFNSFTGCVRGFSGITNLRSEDNSLELVFTDSDSAEHKGSVYDDSSGYLISKGAEIKNLSSLFLNEFLLKTKYQLTPGFENRSLTEKLNQSLFIKQAKDFYNSRGTDRSFEILFKSLYGEDVKIIRPKEYLFRPSDSHYQVANTLVVESVEGNPEDLVNSTLIQETYENYSKAYAPVSKVEKIVSKDGKEYYQLSIDSGYNKDIIVEGALHGDFKVHPTTRVIGQYDSSSTFLDVDSTIGFPKSGELNIIYSDNSIGVVSYTSKTFNQFFGCSNIVGIIEDSSVVGINTYAYGSSFKNQNEIIKVKVTSILNSLNLVDDTYYLKSGYKSKIKTLGTNPSDTLSNNWFFNLATSYEVKSISLIDNSDKIYQVTTISDHNFRIGDSITVLSSSGVEKYSTVININSKKSFRIKGQGELSLLDTYIVKRNILKLYSQKFSDISSLSANVQNVYKDKDKTLVSSPSIPYYSNQPLDPFTKKIVFSGTFDSDTFKITSTTDHGFYTGDAVYYTPQKQISTEFPENEAVVSSLFEEGIYFVKRVNSTTIKLALSRSDLYNSKFISVQSPTTVESNTIEYFKFKGKTLKSQKLLREISPAKNDGLAYETSPGFTGIFINGVELLNYKSTDIIFYGKIEEIDVISNGSGYDVINPPVITINDSVGTGASAHCSINGSLEEIRIIDTGFDYQETPIIKITGGNGKGAQAFANMKLIDHKSIFNSQSNSNQVSLINNSIGFSTYHKFRNSEKVIYKTNSQMGVGGISTDSVYYVSTPSLTEIKLHKTLEDSISGINTVQLTSYGIGNHEFQSVNKKSVLGSINIENSGYGYENKKRTLPSSVTQINTSINQISIVNHGFNSGEIVKYSTTGSVIGGLSNNTEYYLTKIDDDNFKLSEIGSGDINNDFYYETKQYVKLTSIGTGVHIFNYPEISVEVIGNVGISSTSSTDFKAIVQPIFRGEITSVHLENGGVGYGSSEILNYNRQPSITLNSGVGAKVTPIVSNGKIVEVLVDSSGSGYNCPPNLKINGDGFGAVLTPIVNNGKLVEVRVIESGIGYTQNTTSVDVNTPGSLSEFNIKIQSWSVNLFEKNSSTISQDDGILYEGINSNYELQYSHLYSPRKLREIVFANNYEGNVLYGKKDLIKVGNVEISSTDHSPIIGWAYDGNPIYGPYAYSTKQGGIITQMKSGYKLDLKENRPPLSVFPEGFFVEDYTYFESSDESVLDENNGRFCVTPEYPNGTYAYFTTINNSLADSFGIFAGYKRPIFPYVIGNNFYSIPNEFNFKYSSNQDDIDLNDSNWVRNTQPYNLFEREKSYAYLDLPNSLDQESVIKYASPGFVEDIEVNYGGDNYKVGDKVVFDNEGTKGYGVSAEVERIFGKTINSVSVSSTSISNVEIYPASTQETYFVLSENPHNFKNTDIVTISGLSTTSSLFEGSYKVGVSSNTFTLLSGVGNTTTTGIVTYFSVGGNLNYENIRENDILKIEDEQIKVLNVEPQKSRIRVLRGINGTVGSSHSATTVLQENPRKLTITSFGLPAKYEYKINKEFYINPITSVGLGTTSGVGITSTLFFDSIVDESPIGIGTSAKTIIYFEDSRDYFKYNFGGYVDIVNSSVSGFNTSRKKIVSVGQTTITIDFDTSSLSGIGVTAYLNRSRFINIPTRTIYIENHGLETGDLITYSSNGGTSIGISTNGIGSTSLSEGSNLYVAKISNDLIGLSTVKVGLGSTGVFSGITTNTTNTQILYFTNIGSGSYHSFKTNYETITSRLSKNVVTVSTAQTHGLLNGDDVFVDVNPNLSKTFAVKYNDYVRKLLINPKDFSSAGISTNTDTITIVGHGFETGQKVVHTSLLPSLGLENNKEYYIFAVDENNVKLCETYYESQSLKPIFVGISSASDGTLALINPPIKVYKNSTITFDLSDSSLSYVSQSTKYSAFDFKLFIDSNFTKIYETNEDGTLFEVQKIGTVGISSNAKVVLSINENTPDNLYYKLIPVYEGNIPENKKLSAVDTEVVSNNQIQIKNSVYNGRYSIIVGSSTSFTYTLDKNPEFNSYNSETSLLSYETNSRNTSGPISKVKITNKGGNYYNLPSVSSVASDEGSGAILDASSKSIGKIKKSQIKNIGFNFPSDFTIRPSAILPKVIKVEPLSSFESIKVTSFGKGYTSSPKLVVLDAKTNKVINDVDLNYELGNSEVEILKNSSSLSNSEPIILPTQNSNGVGISSIFYNSSTKNVTVTLSTGFSTIDTFPFSINDEVLIENVSVTLGSNGKGFNSENYNYATFTITNIDPNIGGIGSVTYNLNGYLADAEVPGIYDSKNSSGIIVPQKYFPTFKSTIKKNDYLIGEVVESGLSSGVVEDWDSKTNYLKILSKDTFSIDDVIKGKTSNTNGIASSITEFDAFYDIGPVSKIENGWTSNAGFLNDNVQRIQDNFYYQNFSYSIKSKVDYDTWNDAVSTLNHTAGFKKFSDYQLESSSGFNVSARPINPTVDIINDIVSYVDLNCVYNFDLVRENSLRINSRIFSDEIIFSNRVLTDYSESVGNKVLSIDDISPDFNSYPRSTRFSEVDRFDLTSIRSQKYILYVRDKRFVEENQLLSVTTLIDDLGNTYLNQYGRVESAYDMGSFDLSIDGSEGVLNFYPTKYSINDFDVTKLSYNLNEDLSSIGSSTFDYIDIKTSSVSVSSGSTTIVSVANTYRSVKALVLIHADNDQYEFNELSLIHDGTEVEFLEYGQLTTYSQDIFSSSGLGTYYPYISGSELKVDFIPNIGIAATVNTIQVAFASTTSSGINTHDMKHARLEGRSVSIASTTIPTENVVCSYPNEYKGSYVIVQASDITNNYHQFSEIIIVSDDSNVYMSEFGNLYTNSGIGTIGARKNVDGLGNIINEITFTPLANIDTNVKVYLNALRYEDDEKDTIEFLNSTIETGYGIYEGTEKDIKKKFNLTYQNYPIFERYFEGNNSSIVNIDKNTITIPNHFFVTGELVTYSSPGIGSTQAIGIATTTFSGIGATDKLPNNVYVVKVDQNRVKLARNPQDALSIIPKTLDIVSLGIETSHKFTATNQNAKVIISIDNLIQSPIVSTSITTKLSRKALTTDEIIYFSGITSFFGGDIVRIDDEIMRIEGIGIGSTNAIRVRRPWLGTNLAGHSTDSLVTKVVGNYNIIDNVINFSDAPYGNVPLSSTTNAPNERDWEGITVRSSFHGRSFIRSGIVNSSEETYSKNYIFDSISSYFDGYTKDFTLKSNNSNVTGIESKNAIILINDIFQGPGLTYDYNLTETSGITSIRFTGTASSVSYDVNNASIPRGGIIVSVGSTQGFGYQPLISAGGTCNVSIAGTISSISVGNTGSGYRSDSTYDILSSTSINVSAGSTTIFVENENSIFKVLSILNTGSNCTIGVGTYISNASIVSVGTTSINISIGSTSYFEIPAKSIVNVTISNPPVGIVRVGVATSSVGINTITHVGFTTIKDGHISTSVYITNVAYGYTSTKPPQVIFDQPLSYSNIPLIYSSSSASGVGTEAKINIVVGQGSSVTDFEVINTGYGYGNLEILTVPIGGVTGIPTVGSSFKEFQISVQETLYDKFTGWSIGELQVLDRLDDKFDGETSIFTLTLSNNIISIRSSKGSDINVQDTLLVFINDILQVPGKGYSFPGGSVITFTEPPKVGDRSKILFYKGSGSTDVVDVDILETVKIGDELTIGYDPSKGQSPSLQEDYRTVTNIKSTDIVSTNQYFGPGNTSDKNLERPINWCKQTEDKIINQKIVGKDRTLYEALINPTSYLISNVGIGSTIIYVDNIRPFFNQINENDTSLEFQKKVTLISQDAKVGASATAVVSAAGTISNIVITDGGFGYTNSPSVIIQSPVGFGSTAIATSSISSGVVTSISLVGYGTGYTSDNPPLVIIENPTFESETDFVEEYEGDFGFITGISTSSVGVASTALVFDFYIPQDSFLRNSSITGVTTISNIKVGDYFIVYNSNIGNSTISLNSDSSVIGIGTTFLDNVYRVSSVSIGQTNVAGVGITNVAKVTTSISGYNNLTGLGYSGFFGEYSWGKISLQSRSKDNAYTAQTLNGVVGLVTSTVVKRSNPLRYSNYIS